MLLQGYPTQSEGMGAFETLAYFSSSEDARLRLASSNDGQDESASEEERPEESVPFWIDA